MTWRVTSFFVVDNEWDHVELVRHGSRVHVLVREHNI